MVRRKRRRIHVPGRTHWQEQRAWGYRCHSQCVGHSIRRQLGSQPLRNSKVFQICIRDARLHTASPRHSALAMFPRAIWASICVHTSSSMLILPPTTDHLAPLQITRHGNVRSKGMSVYIYQQILDRCCSLRYIYATMESWGIS